MLGFDANFWEQEGFEVLKKHMQQGNEYCDEIASILAERAEASKEYSRQLVRVAERASKAAKDTLGTLKVAWDEFRSEIEAEARWHQNVSGQVKDELVNPLYTFAKEQKKNRKPIADKVDKSLAKLNDARSSCLKAKRTAFQKTKDMEAEYVTYDEAKAGKKRPYTEKELQSLDKSARKAEETQYKSDKEYRASLKELELARRRWDETMIQGCQELQHMEEERINYLKTQLSRYVALKESLSVENTANCDRFKHTVESINDAEDIATATKTKGTGPNHPLEVLYDCYEEDTNNQIRKERRERRIGEKVQDYISELQREKKTFQGVVGLSTVYQNQTNFSDDKGRAEVARQMSEAQRTITGLQACVYKLECSHAEVSGNPAQNHRLAEYIHKRRDLKENMLETTLELNVPFDEYDDDLATFDAGSNAGYVPGNYSGGTLRVSNNTSSRPRAFSATSSSSQASQAETAPPLAQHYEEFASATYCYAIYDYVANNGDELSINVGDAIEFNEDLGDGWSRGTCNGASGLFPSNYVEFR
eukprot:Opistho-2@34379